MNQTPSHRAVAAGAAIAFLSRFLISTTAAARLPGSDPLPEGEGSFPEDSICISGGISAAAQLAFVQISAERASNAAFAVHPARVVDGEFEVDNGNPDFDFEIVGAENKVAEIPTDAGNRRDLCIEARADDVSSP